MIVPLLGVVVSVLIAAPAAARQMAAPLFAHPGSAVSDGAPQAASRGEVAARRTVRLRIEALFDPRTGAAGRVLLNVGPSSWMAQLERVDVDRWGFRSWVGVILGLPESHVVFTERDGIVSGLINALGASYQVRTSRPGEYVIEEIDTSRLADDADPVTSPLAAASENQNQVAGDAGDVVDLLMLFTPAARVKVGGGPQMLALVSQIVSDTNTAFARSGIATRVRLVGTAELSLKEAASLSSDLQTLSSSPAVQALRDQVGADLVQLLVNSPDLSACGIAYLLRSLAAVDFRPYSIADVSCVAQYTPTHEIAHNFGAHHAPEDGAAGALFPYSYAFKDPARGFRTVMAYSCPGVPCPRIPQFSNPGVLYNGGVTGSPWQDNARTLRDASFTVAHFRQSGSVLSDLPGTPTGLRASLHGTVVTVAWNPVIARSETGYVLQVGRAPGAADLFNASVGASTAASGNVEPGTYFWRVIAYNAAGASPPSPDAQFTVPSACVPPTAPRQLAYSVVGRTVALRWLPPFAGTSPGTYIVEAGSQSGAADLFVGAVGEALAFSTPAPPRVYHVRVRARNTCGTSGPSNEVIVAVPAVP